MSVADSPASARGLDAVLSRPAPGLLQGFLDICRRERRIPTYGSVMLFVLVVCLLAPVIAPYPPKETNTSQRLQSPSTSHLMGTDQLGRDTFSRVLYGGRVTLPVGLATVVISAAIGVPLGVAAGYFGGWFDMVMGRWVDAQLAFPGLLLIIGMVNAFGSGIGTVMFIIGFLGFTGYYRLVRGSVLVVRELDYVTSARALGASTPRVMFLHVLPNSLNSLIVLTSLAAGGAVLTLSNLSFLGLGPKAGTPDWGAMFNDALTNFRLQPWLIFGPGICVFITVLSFYMIGDALRDAIDPHLHNKRA